MRNTIKKKKNLKSMKGITLISLIITIIILLILAAISILALTGENGLFTRAKESREKTRGATVHEQAHLWENEKLIYEANNSQGSVPETVEQIVDRLVDQKLLTEDEKDIILGNESKSIEATGEITIGGITTVFEEKLTVGKAYDKNLIQIGSDFKYSKEGQDSWICFGKDDDGNVLLTTKEPIANGFSMNLTAQEWLSYEIDIKNTCEKYGDSSKGITGRSIILKDINKVTGFQEPTDFNTYTFIPGDTNDFEHQRVNYYYPSKKGAYDENYPYFVRATIDEKNVGEGSSDIPAKDFVCSTYYYRRDGDLYKYLYLDEKNLDWSESVLASQLKNMDLVVGEQNQFTYYVGDCSVRVLSDNASFWVAGILNGGIYSSGDATYRTWLFRMAGSNSLYGSNTSNTNTNMTVPIRPIVVLPANLPMQETENGMYELK